MKRETYLRLSVNLEYLDNLDPYGVGRASHPDDKLFDGKTFESSWVAQWGRGIKSLIDRRPWGGSRLGNVVARRWQSNEIAYGDQVGQWLAIAIGCIATTLPAFFLLPVGYFVNEKWKFVYLSGGKPAHFEIGAAFFAAGIFLWILAAYLWA